MCAFFGPLLLRWWTIATIRLSAFGIGTLDENDLAAFSFEQRAGQLRPSIQSLAGAELPPSPHRIFETSTMLLHSTLFGAPRGAIYPAVRGETLSSLNFPADGCQFGAKVFTRTALQRLASTLRVSICRGQQPRAWSRNGRKFQRFHVMQYGREGVFTGWRLFLMSVGFVWAVGLVVFFLLL
jgi:hypothetical protein